ncbi:MAG TPA: single-stranded-DNA-specific exonuclease RecJ [Rhodospirillales bacterium]|nr:single-stranded-DNA-specific exonuclease RecJ [Rhodospirillales bacterium]
MMPSPLMLAADADGAVLGVERSLCGRRWLLRPADDCLVRVLAQTLDVPPVIARMLAARGVEAAFAADFCAPTLRRLLPDPRLLSDMPAAAERIAAAVQGGEAVAVFGDYDVDGATSSALLVRFFRSLGVDATVYIPDRIREGYGPNASALQGLAAAGARLVITVDCGTSAHEALAEAQALGLDVIVVDHHEVGRTLPPAAAVINANRSDDTSGQGHLAAVGVAFLLVVEINRRLREQGFFHRRPEPDLRQWLDLVALGTVCDMVPLRGVNRAFVSQGLKIMARHGNAGIRALAELIDLRHPPGAFELGFMFGPRVNAGGRVGEAGMGARLLSTEDPAEARALAVHLDGFNRERQRIEAEVLDAALDLLQGEAATTRSCLTVAAGEGWHPGVIGIVASRLVERFARPAIVVALDEERGIGSGRSVPGRDLGAAVHAAVESGLLIKGGGHPMAAGFSVVRDRLGELATFLDDSLAASTAEAPPFYLDAALGLVGALPALHAGLERLCPFGSDNPEPRFAIAGARVVSACAVGQGHLRLTLADPEGARLEAIAFRCRGTALGTALTDHAGAAFHLAGRLQAKVWQGTRRLQLLVEDAAPARV